MPKDNKNKGKDEGKEIRKDDDKRQTKPASSKPKR